MFYSKVSIWEHNTEYRDALLVINCSVCTQQGEIYVRFELVLSNKWNIHIEIFINYCVFFQRYPTDKAYFIAKEILATERTYLKDLEVITVVRGFNLMLLLFLTDL